MQQEVMELLHAMNFGTITNLDYPHYLDSVMKLIVTWLGIFAEMVEHPEPKRTQKPVKMEGIIFHVEDCRREFHGTRVPWRTSSLEQQHLLVVCLNVAMAAQAGGADRMCHRDLSGCQDIAVVAQAKAAGKPCQVERLSVEVLLPSKEQTLSLPLHRVK